MSQHQFDQYVQPFTIKQGTTPITPQNTVDVAIKIGDVRYSRSEGTLVYDSASGKWLALIKQEQTQSAFALPMQAEVTFANDATFNKPEIFHSKTVNEMLSFSLDWSE